MIKSMKLAVVAIGSLFASPNLCHALIGETTYTFQADPGQPMQFNGSTVTISSVNSIIAFDIIDPNAAGGQVNSGTPSNVDITSNFPTWASSFQIDYTTTAGGSATITVAGALDGTGSITDGAATGRWTALAAAPDQASTMLLLGLTTGVLGAVRERGRFRIS
jgi:hypothetical protein